MLPRIQAFSSFRDEERVKIVFLSPPPLLHQPPPLLLSSPCLSLSFSLLKHLIFGIENSKNTFHFYCHINTAIPKRNPPPPGQISAPWTPARHYPPTGPGTSDMANTNIQHSSSRPYGTTQLPPPTDSHQDRDPGQRPPPLLPPCGNGPAGKEGRGWAANVR